MAAGSFGADLIRRDFFGRQTAGAGWNKVAGAFEKLQREANGGRVCGGVTDDDMEESGRRKCVRETGGRQIDEEEF